MVGRGCGKRPSNEAAHPAVIPIPHSSSSCGNHAAERHQNCHNIQADAGPRLPSSPLCDSPVPADTALRNRGNILSDLLYGPHVSFTSSPGNSVNTEPPPPSTSVEHAHPRSLANRRNSTPSTSSTCFKKGHGHRPFVAKQHHTARRKRDNGDKPTSSRQTGGRTDGKGALVRVETRASIEGAPFLGEPIAD